MEDDALLIGEVSEQCLFDLGGERERESERERERVKEEKEGLSTVIVISIDA